MFRRPLIRRAGDLLLLAAVFGVVLTFLWFAWEVCQP